MACAMSVQTIGFPNILLPDVLDYLDLEELLLSAMPVNRFWRLSSIEHPRYWKRISLDEEGAHERRVYSADLFCLRLARAGSKPVDISIWMKDPSSVLETLARHLCHIRRLTMWTDIAHCSSIFQSMRDAPAPMLQYLSLNLCGARPSDIPGILPAVLFALDAPVLTEVGLSNIALPSDGALPAWLGNVAAFTYQASWGRQRLPNIFDGMPRLRRLMLRGAIDLDHPAFLQEATWADLEFLSLNGDAVRGLSTLALAQIPRIRLSHSIHLTAEYIVGFVETSPLEVSLGTYQIRCDDADLVLAVELDIVLRWLANPGERRERWMRGRLPRDAPGAYPKDIITAIQHASLLDRLTSLCISPDEWDVLVGRGFLVQFPAVERLTLMLGHRFDDWKRIWRAPARTKKLELPRLRRLAVKYEHVGPVTREPVLKLADLAEFATRHLSGARLPLLLSLEGVSVQGVPKESSDVFSFQVW